MKWLKTVAEPERTEGRWWALNSSRSGAVEFSSRLGWGVCDVFFVVPVQLPTYL
jgi:hypothetical protein